MPAVKPYFVLAFADHKGDLPFIENEREEVREILQDAKIDTAEFDFEILAKSTSTRIVEKFNQLSQIKPCLFHFSGHANHLGLTQNDGQKQTEEMLTAILSNNDIRILFLNACSTGALVKEILNKTSVQAVIATHCPVDDERAYEISMQFYKLFTTTGKNLGMVFNDLVGQFIKPVNSFPAGLKRMDEQDEDVENFDKSSSFAWGLFFKNQNALKLTLANLTEDTDQQIEQLNNLILQLRKEIEKNKINIGQTIPGPLREHFESTNIDLSDEIRRKQEIIYSLLKGRSSQNNSIIQRLYQEDMERALKELNYSSQRIIYTLCDEKIGGFTMLGDEDSVIDLLYSNFWDENKLISQESREVLFLLESGLYEGFWSKLLQEFPSADLDKTTCFDSNNRLNEKGKKQIVEHILRTNYFINDCFNEGVFTQQNVLLKLEHSKYDAEIVARLVSEFWGYVVAYFKSENLTGNKSPDWRHKIIFILIDKAFNDTKSLALRQQAETFTYRSTFKKCFEVLEPVMPLTEAEIAEWIRLRVPANSPINERDAPQIFRDSSGKIRAVLQSLQKTLKERNNVEIPFLNKFITDKPVNHGT